MAVVHFPNHANLPPVERHRLKRYMLIILYTLLASSVVLLQVNHPMNRLTGLFSFIVMVILLFLVHHDKLTLPSYVLPTALLCVVAIFTTNGNNVLDPSQLGYLISIMVAGLLLGVNAVWVFTGLAMLAVTGQFVLLQTGLVYANTIGEYAEFDHFTYILAYLFMGGSLLRLIIMNIETNLANAYASQAALAELNSQLEQRVQERIRDLKLAADVSLQITHELDSSRLLADVVEQTAAAFNLYHVSIFLYDEQNDVLKLEQGVGTAGAKMAATAKQFQLTDTGLVPMAAKARQPALSNDVKGDTGYFNNPLLPETRSELAIPMIYRGTLVGVLDFQSSQVDRFSEEDTRIMRTLADQIAVAVRNSQLFAETQAAREQAEKADKVKSAFLASMSHELRTPLNAIINFSKFLQKGIAGPVNEEQEHLVGSIADSGQHLLNLINDVLDMSKIEAGALKLYIEPDIDLREIIAMAVRYTEPLLADKPVNLMCDVPDDLALLTGDRKRLLQIMLNILSNACKFTEEGHVKVGMWKDTDHLTVYVEDTGSGIAADDAAYVFTAFKQTESGLRQGGGGTGLGMPICQKLVEAHGGRLWFESQVGQGTTFFVELPTTQSERSEHNA